MIGKINISTYRKRGRVVTKERHKRRQVCRLNITGQLRKGCKAGKDANIAIN